ncbi:hypothetical protein R3Q08_29910 [Rhodococcus erythropolis]|uniref:hypothetical protein n=1 Tax=Rhodococcus erythropolis TaxID=1833 RepID=UPI00294937C4|nr:hypothetical protein [Rhodococcus erythropolis]MDV6212483.1 hypothetical protein [Rhodococcus erythropolis]
MAFNSSSKDPLMMLILMLVGHGEVRDQEMVLLVTTLAGLLPAIATELGVSVGRNEDNQQECHDESDEGFHIELRPLFRDVFREKFFI